MLANFDSKKFFIACLAIIAVTLLMVLKTIQANEGLEIFKWIVGLYLLAQGAVDVANGMKKDKKVENVTP